ncbi:MAG: hypothetical protein ACPG6B_05545, partial [Oceanihabitans sp.]
TTLIHKIIAFVLVFVILVPNINTLVIVGDFVVNQEFIAKTLCIQKEAQKGCNGKCQLRKELTKNTNNKNNSEAPLQESKRISLDVFCVSAIHDFEVVFASKKNPKKIFAPQTLKIKKMYLEIDTPPPNFNLSFL